MDQNQTWAIVNDFEVITYQPCHDIFNLLSRASAGYSSLLWMATLGVQENGGRIMHTNKIWVIMRNMNHLDIRNRLIVYLIEFSLFSINFRKIQIISQNLQFYIDPFASTQTANLNYSIL